MTHGGIGPNMTYRLLLLRCILISNISVVVHKHTVPFNSDNVFSLLFINVFVQLNIKSNQVNMELNET